VGVAAGVAILAGGIGGIVALLLGRGRKSAIPFGPYLAAGAIVASLWGDRIARWYLDTFV
jgi:leader peptidase (prepilin peptidase)/N-methyltransferase